MNGRNQRVLVLLLLGPSPSVGMLEDMPMVECMAVAEQLLEALVSLVQALSFHLVTSH